MMLKLGVTNGPSEKGLVFSYWDDNRKTTVEFEADEIGYYSVVINRLARTDHPHVWGWRGRVSDFVDYTPTVWGLFDVKKRDGVLFSPSPLSHRGRGGSVTESTVQWVHPVEIRVPETARNLISEEPTSKEPGKRLPSKRLPSGQTGKRGIWMMVMRDGIWEDITVTQSEWRDETFHFKGVTVPHSTSPHPAGRREQPVIGYWDKKEKIGYMARNFTPNYQILAGLSS